MMKISLTLMTLQRIQSIPREETLLLSITWQMHDKYIYLCLQGQNMYVYSTLSITSHITQHTCEGPRGKHYSLVISLT